MIDRIDATTWRLRNITRMVAARHQSRTLQVWLLALAAMLIYAIAAGAMK